MKIFQKINKFFVAACFTFVSAIFCGSNVFADELPDYRLQISPAKIDVGDLKPGEVYTGTFQVQNTGKKTFDFKVGVSPYTVADEYYSPKEESNNYTDIVEWIEFSRETGTVEPNGDAEVVYTITVPADVPAGGQYAMLTAEITNNTDESNNSGIVTVNRVGLLLYSNVQGNTRKTGSVIENKIPSFKFNPPLTATSIVENTGNTHTNAKYVLEVYPLFSDEEVYTNKEKPTELTILPDTRRFNEIVWPNSPQLGIFKVRQTVTIFDQVSTTEKIVFLCPIWFMFIVLLIIFCVIFWIVSRIREHRKSNQ